MFSSVEFVLKIIDAISPIYGGGMKSVNVFFFLNRRIDKNFSRNFCK